MLGPALPGCTNMNAVTVEVSRAGVVFRRLDCLVVMDCVRLIVMRVRRAAHCPASRWCRLSGTCAVFQKHI